MKLDKLSWRARCKLEMYAEMISNRAFDSDDIELFLVYAREAFKDEKDSVIAGFGDTMAHSIRDRGQLQEISKRLQESPKNALYEHPKKPLGNDGSVDECKLRKEMNELFNELHLGKVNQEAFDDIKLCLCVISNQTLLTETYQRKASAMGEARLLILDKVASLDVMSYDKRIQIIVLQAPIQGYEGRFVDVGKHYAYAKRKEPGKPLEVVCRGAEIDQPNEPGPLKPPTQEQVEYDKEAVG